MTATRRVVTSADVRDASISPARRIQLSDRDLVTPLARDDAAELGVVLAVDDTPDPGAGHAATTSVSTTATWVDGQARITAGSDLETAVRRIVASLASPGHHDATRPVVHVDGRGIQMQLFPFPGPAPTMDCRLADVITAEEHHAPMAAGFMSLHAGQFPWTLDYDEIEYVIEGELHVGTDAGTVVGRPGDLLYVPKGSSITFGTPSWAKFLYVTHPADWAGAS